MIAKGNKPSMTGSAGSVASTVDLKEACQLANDAFGIEPLELPDFTDQILFFCRYTGLA
ncbi:hypothetical protein Cflav_PD0672 [Pedosphaera parvula Ellin514]|uniref:Uncharacterized protein n=1 Tax=Pedosphaera parvula (strain Ellin514) TaxID=320771 RepID=B9XRE7_PEDPL|nr:hypothetical protein Cflav_PD0672 [Pedosphaera parvula Ellin514]